MNVENRGKQQKTENPLVTGFGSHTRAHGDVVSLPEVIASLLASLLCRATSWRDRQLSTPRRSQALLQTRQFSGAR